MAAVGPADCSPFQVSSRAYKAIPTTKLRYCSMGSAVRFRYDSARFAEAVLPAIWHWMMYPYWKLHFVQTLHRSAFRTSRKMVHSWLGPVLLPAMRSNTEPLALLWATAARSAQLPMQPHSLASAPPLLTMSMYAEIAEATERAIGPDRLVSLRFAPRPRSPTYGILTAATGRRSAGILLVVRKRSCRTAVIISKAVIGAGRQVILHWPPPNPSPSLPMPG